MWKEEKLDNVITLIWCINDEHTIEHPLQNVSVELYKILTRRFGRPKGVIKDVTTYYWQNENIIK